MMLNTVRQPTDSIFQRELSLIGYVEYRNIKKHHSMDARLAPSDAA